MLREANFIWAMCTFYRCFVTPGKHVHIRDFDKDLKGFLKSVPMQWKRFVGALTTESLETYDRHNNYLRFRSVLVSLGMRSEPPFSKRLIYDTLKCRRVGLSELAEQWEKNYMVSALCK